MTSEATSAGLDSNGGARPEREERPVVLSDPKAIRALAHGVRLQVIEELFDSDSSYTATDLGHRFGLTPSAMSYHLRSLERWGLVVRAEGTGDGRERHWRSAGTHLTIDTSESGSNPAALSMMDVQINQLRDRLTRYFNHKRPVLPAGQTMADVRRLPAMLQGSVCLAPHERAELADEIWALVDRFRKSTQEAATERARAQGEDPAEVERFEFFLSFLPESLDEEALSSAD